MKRKEIEKGKEIGGEKGKKKSIKRLFVLMAELIVLTVLVAVAFFAPQIIFQIQDYFLCANTALSKREAMDVETLSITYERSLKQRLLNYAEGLNDGETYYVAEQVFDINQEVYDFISDTIYQQIILEYVDVGIIPEEFFNYESEYTVTQWKRYVIYSDDYAKGVSFILWYIELQDRTGMVMKLLTDGEDGTIYALKTETGGLLDQNETSMEEYVASANKSMNSRWILYYDDYLIGRWEMYSLYYEALDKEETNAYIIKFMEQYDPDENILWERDVYEYDSEGFAMCFFLPYGNVSIEFMVDIGETDLGLKYVTYRYPDFTMGIRQIYEKIPEFA